MRPFATGGLRREPHRATLRAKSMPHDARDGAALQARRDESMLPYRAPLSERDVANAFASFEKQLKALGVPVRQTLQRRAEPGSTTAHRRRAQHGSTIQRAERSGTRRGLMGEKTFGAIGEALNFSGQISSFLVSVDPLTVGTTALVSNCFLCLAAVKQIVDAYNQRDTSQQMAGVCNLVAALLGIAAAGATIAELAAIAPAFIGLLSALSWLLGELISNWEQQSSLFYGFALAKGLGALASTSIGLVSSALGSPLIGPILTAVSAGIPALGSLGAASLHVQDALALPGDEEQGLPLGVTSYGSV